jgi:DNA repair photolyase
MNIKPSGNRPIMNPCTLENFDYQIDPYIGCAHGCHYCYVLEYAETDWSKEILYHADIADRLKSQLSAIPPQTIYMGWHTDPYQPCEAEYRQTRKILECLTENGFSVSILTKSDLVLRDMDLLQSMDGSAVSVSVAFNDEGVRRLFEANTKETAARISALQQLKDASIRTSALICPVIPHITDVSALIDLLADPADKIWIYGLSILDRSNQSWRNVKRILDNNFPDLKKQIETVVFSKDPSYWEILREELVQIQSDRNLDLSIHV